VATGSALTHFTFVAHHGLIPVQGKNFAIVFMVPTNAKGVKLICRVSNEMRAALLGAPSTIRCRAGWTRTTRSS
jgi:4-hydroxyphenylacetate 3-monooxygenase